MTTSTATDRRTRLRSWLLVGLPVLFIVGLVAANGLQGGDATPEDLVVPDFELPTTAGTMVNRSEVVGGVDALFYFSMGPGCDGCFAQIPEISAGLAQRGVRLVPIMVDPVDAVAREAARFGITQPILIDGDRRLSQAMGMLGIYGHADRPSHSFALVGPDGRVTWVRHYPEMFVPAEEFFAELDQALASAGEEN